MYKTIIILFIFSSIIAKTEAQTYSLFNKDLQEVIVSIDVIEKKEVIINRKEIVKQASPLVSLSDDIYAINKKIVASC